MELQLLLELLDLSVSLFEILVEAVALGNELLLPLSEALLLDLDLLGESLSESLLLLLELGVVELAGTGLAKLAGLHLLGAVSLVMQLLGGVDKVEHVCSDQNRAELLEVAVVLVLNLGDTPRVLATLNDAAITSLDILLGTDNGERHGVHKAASVLGSGLVVLLDRGLVDLDVLGLDDRDNLGKLVGRAESISLGDNRDQVNARAEALHDLNIERLEGVAGRADKVQAGMDTEINLVLTAGLLLLEHVRLVLVVEELDDGHPRVAVVDIVAESGGIDNELLLKLGLGNLNLDGLVDLLLVASLVIGVVLDGGREESVDEGSLAQTRLASNLDMMRSA
ncbi:hypothetical protein HG531_004329 [Fusarium graminearum]|nr:hypothetical protein HG531_004329 [Fusarium graminearum]